MKIDVSGAGPSGVIRRQAGSGRTRTAFMLRSDTKRPDANGVASEVRRAI